MTQTKPKVSDLAQTTRLSVGMPVLFKSNPYQDKLLCHLVDANIAIDTAEFRSLFKKIVRREPIQILHLNWIHTYLKARNSLNSLYRFLTFILRLLIIRVRGVSIVWTVHNLSSHEGNYPSGLDRWARRILANLSRAIIVHCQVAEEEVKKKFGVSNAEKIFLIPHGNYIDLYENTISRQKSREELGLAETDKVILFMGIIRPYKGIYELIETFKAVGKSQNVKLIIAGKLLEAGDAEGIADAVKNVSNILFKPGYVPDRDVQIYMNACDVVVLPYKNILTSGAAILAMSFGKPCVAPSIGCMEEFIGSKGGFLYEPEQSNGLEIALHQATESSFAELEQMGQLNLAKAKSWDWESVSEQFRCVYEYCIRT
ncbi:glycosyltransferase [Nodosilinea sp. LEGE 07088]|uniref:glycosyltransferase n=1 Tax=Nodosilinea sp. LEGE 07088 TaxID=2777968 RepID=UPI0018830B48|nr:glycosyltransferase [Nodosilinea sp. LEGE 07088]MBE9139439.1 glycosyltransferase [Nodosilinea sp. LEGE 07088]